MRIAALLFIAAVLLLPAFVPSLEPIGAQVEPADIVFKNANVYTVNDAQPKAEAIAIKYGRVAFVGSNADVKKYEGKKVTKEIGRAHV